jgi:tetratricopeptide (TPR) repeat protein
MAFTAVAQAPQVINYQGRLVEGRYEDCIHAAGLALRARPDYDLAYNNICAACNRLGLWDRAVEAGEKALACNPTNRLVRNNLDWARRHRPR